MNCNTAHLANITQCQWDKVAAELGYKDASIAKTRWGQIRRKKIDSSAAGGVDKAASGKVNTAKPKKTTSSTKKSANKKDIEISSEVKEEEDDQVSHGKTEDIKVENEDE